MPETTHPPRGIARDPSRHGMAGANERRVQAILDRINRLPESITDDHVQRIALAVKIADARRAA